MAAAGRDYLADLTTAPIFDQTVYLAEALHFSEGQSEDEHDSQLALLARASGIEDPYRFLCPDAHELSTAVSTMTISSEQGSSMSIYSGESQSTGATSHPSRTSKDNPPVRPSLSSDDYDAMISRLPHNNAHRASTSTASGSNSIVSNSSSFVQPTPRRQKLMYGLALFSMFRRDQSTFSCASRSHHGHQSKPLTPKLECGHALSRYAIGVHIEEALAGSEHVAPHCCGKPLPRFVLEMVLTKDEVELVAPSRLQSPGLSSSRDSGYNEDGAAVDAQSQPTESFVTASETPSRELRPEDEECLSQALADKAFKALTTQQRELFQRVSLFESNQRKALLAYHQWSLERLTPQCETSKAEKTKQHAIELERLDESQIAAEHDLRKAHAQETQNGATALKYMEAYCSGSNPTNPEVAHTVTEEDRKKLARQHLTQQKLPAKHESAINVLRARQEKDIKVKLQKQQDELKKLDADCERKKRAEELQYQKDSSRLDALIEARRRKVIHRRDLQLEMWRRDWENEHGKSLNGPLPHEDWPEIALDAPLDPSSALALYLQRPA